jgi:LmbE family N-acetylglucosaminyl deacetylase
MIQKKKQKSKKPGIKRAVLAVGAHPDDIEFSCTGLLMKLIERGYEVYYVVATNGENGFKVGSKPRKQRITIRHMEQFSAAQKLGVKKVFFLGYKDGFLANNDELRKKLVRIIKNVKPEIIFSFDPANRTYENINLQHRDHRNIGKAVFDAVFAAKNKYMYPGKPHKVDYFYFFGAAVPDYFEDISGYINKKLEILKEHKSQFSDFSKVENWVRNYLSKFTRKYKYSEAFRVIKVEQIFK